MGDSRIPVRGADHKVVIERLLGGTVRDVSQFSMGFRTFSSLDEPFMLVDVILSDQDNIVRDAMGGNPTDHSVVIGHTAANGQKIAGRFHIASMSTNTQQSPKKAQTITLHCKGQEHLLNEQTKYRSNSDYWVERPPTEIIGEILRTALGITPKGNGLGGDEGASPFSFPAMHPIQIVSWLSSCAYSKVSQIHGCYAFYQKFSGGKAEYYFDDVVELLQGGGTKWKFLENETNMGAQGDSRPVDIEYVNGSNISPIIDKYASNFQNGSAAVQVGIGKRSSVNIDTINKKANFITIDMEDTFIGAPQMPEVKKYISTVKQTGTQGRVLYEPTQQDPTINRAYPYKPIKAWRRSRHLLAQLLSKRVEIRSYGTPEVGPGDRVELVIPEYNASSGRGFDTTNGGPYMVFSIEHLCDRNGEFTSNLMLTRDGVT